jgi:hypothetical protein
MNFKKIKKLLNNPNLFFYDMFRKRVFQESLPVSAETAHNSSKIFDPIQENAVPTEDILCHLINTACATVLKTDYNSNANIVMCGTQVIRFLHHIAKYYEKTHCGILIYTENASYFFSNLDGAPFDLGKIEHALYKKSDFVLELRPVAARPIIITTMVYDLDPAGMVILRSNKSWMRKFPIALIDSIHEPMTAPPRKRDVDVVYTWVNHADPHWIEIWNNAFPTTPYDQDRFSANDELKFSLRSVDTYAPWIRNIFIVSNCAPPLWLDLSGRISWVSHEQIFPDPTALPTFNSHAIETCLHRIEGLSENFLYFNDDFFLNQPTSISDFFDDLFRPLINFEPYGMVDHLPARDDQPDYMIASKNSRALLREINEEYQPRALHRHVPYALTKAGLMNIEEKFQDTIQRTRGSKIRSHTDVNLTSFLFHHHEYLEGRASKGDYASMIVRPTNIDKLLKKDFTKYKVLCFNDGNGSSADVQYKEKCLTYYQLRFPHLAPWEILD